MNKNLTSHSRNLKPIRSTQRNAAAATRGERRDTSSRNGINLSSILLLAVAFRSAARHERRCPSISRKRTIRSNKGIPHRQILKFITRRTNGKPGRARATRSVISKATSRVPHDSAYPIAAPPPRCHHALPISYHLSSYCRPESIDAFACRTPITRKRMDK